MDLHTLYFLYFSGFKAHLSVQVIFCDVWTFHMAMLLPFNNSTTVTEQELLDTTGLPVNELHKHIKTLLDTKFLLSQVGKVSIVSFILFLS